MATNKLYRLLNNETNKTTYKFTDNLQITITIEHAVSATIVCTVGEKNFCFSVCCKEQKGENLLQEFCIRENDKGPFYTVHSRLMEIQDEIEKLKEKKTLKTLKT